jgi:hypothetical protein
MPPGRLSLTVDSAVNLADTKLLGGLHNRVVGQQLLLGGFRG